MIFKKFKPFNAPKVFQFKDPDTGRDFNGSSISDLIRQIEGYRSQNDLEPLEFLHQVIENHLCQMPRHAGSCTPVKDPKRSVVQYLQGGMALLKNIAYKSFASQEEADRRSDVCVACPQNQFPDRSKAFVTWANDMADRSIGKLKSKNHDKLGICGACSCPLRSKVFYDGKIKLSPEQLKQMEGLNCWQPEFTK